MIVMVALMAMLLFGLAALAFDLSLAMADRRDLQAEADNAALAGAASYPTGANAAHYVAMQYLQKPLGFSLPQGSCSSTSACPAGTYTLGKYTVTIADPGSNQLDLAIRHQEPGIFASLIGAGVVTTGNSARAQAPGPTIIPATYSAEALTGSLDCNGCGNGKQVVTGSVYVAVNFGGNNSPHAIGVPSVQTNFDGTTACPGSPTTRVDFGGSSSTGEYWNWKSGSGSTTTSLTVTGQYDNQAPTVLAAVWNSGNIASAKDGSGNWKPGTYDGVSPNGGTLNPGVYKIKNYTGTINPGANAISAPAGTEDAAGAVVIMLDSTDTGGLDLTNTTLNGIDDLHPASYTGPRDPQGTHNFAFWSSSGASGYTGGISVGSTTVSGITYLPKSALSQNGNASFTFDGATILASAHISGGGNGTQAFNYVCGIGAVLGNPAIQGGLNR